MTSRQSKSTIRFLNAHSNITSNVNPRSAHAHKSTFDSLLRDPGFFHSEIHNSSSIPSMTSDKWSRERLRATPDSNQPFGFS